MTRTTFLPFSIPVKRGSGLRIEGGLYIVTTAEIEELVYYMDASHPQSGINIEGKLVIFPKPYPTLLPVKPFGGFRGFDKWRFFRDIELTDKVRIRKVPHLDMKIAEFGKKRARLKNCYYANPEQEQPYNRSWLHWIGNAYYSIESFIDEARIMGLSRRVPERILRKMKWGDTIFLASKEKKVKSPVVFGYFTLHKIQGVKVDMEDLPEHLQDKIHYEETES